MGISSTVNLDATIIASAKRDAKPTDEGGGVSVTAGEHDGVFLSRGSACWQGELVQWLRAQPRRLRFHFFFSRVKLIRQARRRVARVGKRA